MSAEDAEQLPALNGEGCSVEGDELPPLAARPAALDPEHAGEVLRFAGVLPSFPNPPCDQPLGRGPKS